MFDNYGKDEEEAERPENNEGHIHPNICWVLWGCSGELPLRDIEGVISVGILVNLQPNEGQWGNTG